MKKVIAIIIGAIVSILGICGIYRYVNDEPIVEIIDEPVCYYGCPNSKRVRKLNVSKKKGKRI